MTLLLPTLMSVVLLQGAETGLIEEFDTALERTGFVKLAATPAELLGPEAAAAVSHVVFADEPVQWHAYVPKDYTPQDPPGVLVFISTDDFGGMPTEWMSVMDESNLIWVSPRFAGSGVPTEERVLKAVLAPHVVDARYRVNSRRVYIGGYAGGGQIAGFVQSADPETFRGGMYVCGAMSWDGDPPKRVESMRETRHVFIGGCGNRDRREMRRIRDDYLQAGIEDASLISIDLPRGFVPQRRFIRAAIDYLDGDDGRTSD